MKAIKYLIIGLLSLSVSIACTGQSGQSGQQTSPDSQSNSYQDGDRVTLVLGSSPGGGFDTQARLLASYLEDALRQSTEANVTVVVQNKPGAAHQVATKYVNNSPPDGTRVLFTSAQLAATNQVVRGADFDLRKMTPVGSAGTPSRAIAVLKDLDLPESTFNGLVARSQRTCSADYPGS